jgi:hypothetical protein
MNERIKELAEQAGLEELGDGDWCSLNHPDVRAEHLEHFAELVRQDEREWVGLHWDDIPDVFVGDIAFLQGAKWALAKLRSKNGY